MPQHRTESYKSGGYSNDLLDTVAGLPDTLYVFSRWKGNIQLSPCSEICVESRTHPFKGGTVAVTSPETWVGS